MNRIKYYKKIITKKKIQKNRFVLIFITKCMLKRFKTEGNYSLNKFSYY